MIIDLFSSIALAFYKNCYELLPVAVFPTEVNVFFDLIYQGLKVVFTFLPVDDIMGVVYSVLAIEGSILAAKLIFFAYNALRGTAPMPPPPSFPKY